MVTPVTPFPAPPTVGVPVAVAAPAGLPPVRMTDGADVYPSPPESTTMDVTLSPVRTAWAVAPDPPPPENDTVGADI
jgi:hypothetical protein